jgi:hypothetical protein
MPVILVLQGGRPFAIPEYYSQASAVLNTVGCSLMHNSVTLSNDIQFFGGQAGGQAISDALFGITNPGGRVPLSVPYNVGTIPIYYK